MKRHDWMQILAYVLVSIASVGAAFALSVKFLGRSSAQEAQQNPEAEAGRAATPPENGQPTDSEPSTSNSSGIAELEGFLEPFIYDVVNRRDPFLPYADYVTAPTEQSPIEGTSPAQRFSLEELKLVGVMWDVKDPKAMFMDPENEVLMLGRDESIGNRNGYIAAIREGEVVVVEAIRRRGDIIYRTRVLRIER